MKILFAEPRCEDGIAEVIDARVRVHSDSVGNTQPCTIKKVLVNACRAPNQPWTYHESLT